MQGSHIENMSNALRIVDKIGSHRLLTRPTEPEHPRTMSPVFL